MSITFQSAAKLGQKRAEMDSNDLHHANDDTDNSRKRFQTQRINNKRTPLLFLEVYLVCTEVFFAQTFFLP